MFWLGVVVGVATTLLVLLLVGLARVASKEWPEVPSDR
jgi:hypothetical protein